MKKVILVLVLALVSSNVMAEWVRVGTGKTYILYVENSRIKVSGNKRLVWTMSDFFNAKTSSSGSYLSTKDKYEIDCFNETVITLIISRYSENAGKGKRIDLYTYNDRLKYHVTPESLFGVMVDHACNIK